MWRGDLSCCCVWVCTVNAGLLDWKTMSGERAMLILFSPDKCVVKETLTNSKCERNFNDQNMLTKSTFIFILITCIWNGRWEGVILSDIGMWNRWYTGMIYPRNGRIKSSTTNVYYIDFKSICKLDCNHFLHVISFERVWFVALSYMN